MSEELLLTGEVAGAAVTVAEGPAAWITIAEAKALPAGALGVTFRGTVVWAEDDELIVQDESGSLRLQTSEECSAGDVVRITGQVEQAGFLAGDVTVQGTGPLPAAQVDSLSEMPEDLRVLIRDGFLRPGVLTKNGEEAEAWAEEAYTGKADVYGILIGGILYIDTVVPAAKPDREWKACFGLLDAHTDLSDGLGTVQEAYRTAREAGLDFFAVTDHSTCMDSGKWEKGKQAAAEATGDAFVGIFGYEMTWGEDERVGHINTFATPGWLTPRTPGMDTLSDYCAALAKVPGQVSQFNHPSDRFGDFGGFRDYDPADDACVQLLQVEGEDGESFFSYYIQALDCGWHVAPTVGQDNHRGQWGTAGSSRTAVLVKTLSEEGLFEAMAARRVYATKDPDLYIDYRLNGNLMGSVMGTAEGLTADVVLEDPTDGPEARVEIIGTGGAVLASGDTLDGTLSLSVPGGYPYYFLRVIRDGSPAAVTAPVWVDDFQDMGISGFTADTDSPLTGHEVKLTLELYNREEVPFEITGVELYCGERKLGQFASAGTLRYDFPLLRENPGQARLTAVVRGTVDGVERSYERELTLGFGVPDPVGASIRQARDGNPGLVFSVEGHATSGNTNPHTTFPDTIYLQDDTGGIPVRGEFRKEIQVGTPLKITGVLREDKGERYLELTEGRVLDKAMYRYVPRNLSCREATDYALRGGSLVQTQGTVTAVTSDEKEVSGFTLRDSRGDTARIMIAPEIRSGAGGVNELGRIVKKGETVRAMGLLSLDGAGRTVLRVRNCDEVAAVEPVPVPPAAAAGERAADESNPRTGDGWFWRLFADFLR